MSAHPGPLFAALAKAQAQMDNVVKDSANPHFRSRFASLAAVRDVVIPALSAQGIAVVQTPGRDDAGRVTVRTLLLHESGSLDCGAIAATATVRGGNEAQAVGSAITYLRRYALASICAVAQEDDDGNASGPRREQARPRARRPAAAAADDLKAALFEAFGPASDPDALAQAEELARLTCQRALADVFPDEAACRTMLAALEGGGA